MSALHGVFDSTKSNTFWYVLENHTQTSVFFSTYDFQYKAKGHITCSSPGLNNKKTEVVINNYPYFKSKSSKEILTKKATKLLCLDNSQDNQKTIQMVVDHIDKLSIIIIESYISSKGKSQ